MTRIFRDTMDYVDAARVEDWDAIEEDIARDWLDPVSGTAGRKAGFLFLIGAAIQRHEPTRILRFETAIRRAVNRAVGRARVAAEKAAE
jgi:hypothetical protein